MNKPQMAQRRGIDFFFNWQIKQIKDSQPS